MPSTMKQQDLWIRGGLFFRKAFDAVFHNILVPQLGDEMAGELSRKTVGY